MPADAHFKYKVNDDVIFNLHIFKAERKIREAMVKERDASDLEKLVCSRAQRENKPRHHFSFLLYAYPFLGS